MNPLPYLASPVCLQHPSHYPVYPLDKHGSYPEDGSQHINTAAQVPNLNGR